MLENYTVFYNGQRLRVGLHRDYTLAFADGQPLPQVQPGFFTHRAGLGTPSIDDQIVVVCYVNGVLDREVYYEYVEITEEDGERFRRWVRSDIRKFRL